MWGFFNHNKRQKVPRPAIPTCRRLRQEDLEFKGSLDYTARPCLKANGISIKPSQQTSTDTF
jgi:hypothetical protein